MATLLGPFMKLKFGTRWTRPTPDALIEGLKAVGGCNLYGEPNYRVIWGGQRKAWVGGKFEGEKDKHGNLLPAFIGMKHEPRHWAHVEKWLLETWMPPERYGRIEDWDEDGLGPFPSRGDYELVRVIDPVEFSPAQTMQFIRFMDRARNQSKYDRRDAHQEVVDKQDRDWDRLATDIIDDGIPAFGGFSHAVVPSGYTTQSGG